VRVTVVKAVHCQENARNSIFYTKYYKKKTWDYYFFEPTIQKPPGS
jgi:hypothetical protein